MHLWQRVYVYFYFSLTLNLKKILSCPQIFLLFETDCFKKMKTNLKTKVKILMHNVTKKHGHTKLLRCQSCF